MAAPQYVPTSARDKAYESPDHVPVGWSGGRPAELNGRQPSGTRLGNQGPDQGFGLILAERFRDKLQLTAGEHADDAITGCLGVALARASLFGRAPVIHDYTVAFTIFGFLDAKAPAELVELRRQAFEGVHLVAHHYAEARAIVDRVPESTLRLTHQQVASAYPARWRELIGA